MKTNKLLLCLIFCTALLLHAETPAGLDVKNIKNAWKSIQSGKKMPAYSPVFKVVYFHAADQQPLAGWNTRLPHTLDDVSRYYAEEAARFGVKIQGIPFERGKDGQIVIHCYQGENPAAVYSTSSGMKIQEEITRASKGNIDFQKDHVLIINGLCDKDSLGHYNFHSPYHGTGSGRSGVCHVADCELLDSHLLTDTVHRMTFTEMAAVNRECTVANFNSWYIGGIAHEMGHVFVLSHDYGNLSERNSATISLMGEYGSRHYRDYLWGGNPSSHFSAAGMLQLLAHPLIARKGPLPDMSQSEFNSYKIVCIKSDSVFNLGLKYSGNRKPYGISVLLRKSGVSEYLNESFYTTTSLKTDTATVLLRALPFGKYVVLVKFLFPDGNLCNAVRLLTINPDGGFALTEELDEGFIVSDFYLRLLNAESNPVIQAMKEVVYSVLYPTVPVDPATSQSDSLYLSDAEWKDARVGWRVPARNYFSTEYESTFFLINQNQLFTKGLYAHSPAVYSFDLKGRWKTFSGITGLRDLAHEQGSARFRIFGDGKELFVSDALRVGGRQSFKIDITGVNILELKTEGTEGHNHNSWAVWLAPLLKR